jgi:hypothetical protein
VRGLTLHYVLQKGRASVRYDPGSLPLAWASQQGGALQEPAGRATVGRFSASFFLSNAHTHLRDPGRTHLQPGCTQMDSGARSLMCEETWQTTTCFT